MSCWKQQLALLAGFHGSKNNPDHFLTTQPSLPLAVERLEQQHLLERVSMQTLLLPVFIPVHSPDHRYADAYGKQQQWPHRDVFAPAGEAEGKMRRQQWVRKCVPPADRSKKTSGWITGTYAIQEYVTVQHSTTVGEIFFTKPSWALPL